MLGLFLLLIIVIGIVLAINGDKWFPSKYHTTYICNMEGKIVDMFEDHTRPIDNNPYDDDDEDEMYETMVYLEDDDIRHELGEDYL